MVLAVLGKKHNVPDMHQLPRVPQEEADLPPTLTTMWHQVLERISQGR